MPDLCLDSLTCPHTNPVGLVRMAAEMEVPLVSLRVYTNPKGGPGDWQLLGDTPMRRATRNICQTTGVRIDMIESFCVRPETDLEAFLPAFETGALLGARTVSFVTQDSDCIRLLERTHQFIDMGAAHGLEMLLEFTPWMTQRTLADAIAFRAKLGRPELRIHVDSLHDGFTDLPGTLEDHVSRGMATMRDYIRHADSRKRSINSILPPTPM